MPSIDRLLLGCLLVAAIVPYLDALANGFAFDDRWMIVGNPTVQQADTPLAELFTEPYYPGALYRPIVFCSYWLDQRLHGPGPFGFHAVNVGLHALVTVLLFALFRSMRVASTPSFLAALVFAVHPIHTEAVTSIVGRAELLSAAAVLGALLCSRKSAGRRLGPRTPLARSRAAWLVAASLLFAVGLLSKESAFVFLPLLVVTTWIAERRPLPQTLRSLIRSGEMPVFAAIGAAYLGLRWALLGTLTVGDPVAWLDNPLAHSAAEVRLGTATVVLVDSMAQLLLPLRLSADYSFNQIPLVESLADPRLLVSLALLLLLGLLLWHSGGRAPAAVAGGVLFFLAAFSLTSNFLFPIGTIRAERLLYLPSAGFCLIAGLAGAWSLRQRPGWAAVALALLISAYAGRTWARNLEWGSDAALFTATMDAAPQSAKANLNFGAALEEMHRYDDAAMAYRQALRIYPKYEEAAFAIGHIYDTRGMTAGALHWYDEALRLDPKHVKSYLNRGTIFYNTGELDAAEDSFNAGLRVQPGDPRLLTGIGFVRLAQGRIGEALAVLEEAEQTAPDDPQTRRALEFAEQRAAGPMEGS